MINVSISYGFGPDNRYKLKHIPVNIQLSLYKYKLWEDHKNEIVDTIYKENIRVNVVHLPLDTMSQSFDKIHGMIQVLRGTILCKKFVVHPNKGIKFFIQSFLELENDTQLCVENFQYKQKKELRNILYIIEECIRYDTPRLKACLDTSHTEDTWFHPHILPYILKHTSVIHLSNRKKGTGLHLPFNMQDGELNLVGFVKDLSKRHQWKGDIVLEYMGDYHHKLFKNHDYLVRLLK